MNHKELAAALRRGAAGWDAPVAAVELLVAHRVWLPRMASHPAMHHVDDRGDVDWIQLGLAISRGKIAGSSSELAVLNLACSLGGGTPVSLRDAVVGLDLANTRLVANAVARAAGHRRVL